MKQQESALPVNWNEVLLLALLMALVAFFWSSRPVYPLKVLVTLTHGLSQGLVASMAGGTMGQAAASSDQGIECAVTGGNQFAVLVAGYLGCIIWGGAILVLAAWTHADRVAAGTLGGMLFTTTLLLVRPPASFAFLVGFFTSAALVLSGAYLGERFNDYLLRAIGLATCLFPLFDVKRDMLDQVGPKSDARLLAEHIKIPVQVSGIFWGGIAIAVSVYLLVAACRKREKEKKADPSAKKK